MLHAARFSLLLLHTATDVPLLMTPL